MRRLLTLAAALVALALPASAAADTTYRAITYTLDAQATYISNIGQYEVMSCDEQAAVGSGGTLYLLYPGLISQGGNTQGGNRKWHVGAFVAWTWHRLDLWSLWDNNGMRDTGDATQEFGGWTSLYHNGNPAIWQTVSTRRFFIDDKAVVGSSGSAYDYDYGLKVVHDYYDGGYPMVFERADC